jgi:hypothetical protein
VKHKIGNREKRVESSPPPGVRMMDEFGRMKAFSGNRGNGFLFSSFIPQNFILFQALPHPAGRCLRKR